MFELEDYSSGYHEGFLNKHIDSYGPTLDLYISDSLQDMLDVDIRSEIANVVGSGGDFGSLMSDLPSSLDNAVDAISAISGASGSAGHLPSFSSHSSSSWMSMGASWSTQDFYADVGACVNPISVMPIINSSMLHASPKTNLNANAASQPSPTGEVKSHLTFSPAQVKVSACTIRQEQLTSHVPKQIVSISSSVTAATTAPATMATNSALQRKNSAAVDAVRKDLGVELKKSSVAAASDEPKSLSHSNASGMLNGGVGATNTIKLAPGIGGLTFANSITYNKLKQQSNGGGGGNKSPQGSSVTANGSIVLKRERDSTNGGQQFSKITARSAVAQMAASGGIASYTPKSIASSHSPLMQSMGSPLSSSGASTASSNGGGSSKPLTSGLTPISVNHFAAVNSLNTTTITTIPMKPLQHHRIKGGASAMESEYPKPAYSYSCLIAMALKNSRSGSLPVSEIYSFMCEHFPYFKTAPSGWKNSVRHNLSLNKCFEKIEKPITNGNQRKGCLWAMNPERIGKMDEEVQKWSRKDPLAIRSAMVFPEHLEALERGEMKHGSTGDSDNDLDSQSEIEETSDLEEQELDEQLVDNMFVEEDLEEEDEEQLHEEDGEDEEDSMLMEEMMDSSIVVVNGSEANGNGAHGLDELSAQHQRDFDIEVEDMYDTFDIEDDKEAVRAAIRNSDIIELSPSDLNKTQSVAAIIANNNNNNINNNNHKSISIADYQTAKRPRLSLNYAIATTADLEKQLKQKTSQSGVSLGGIKQIKVQAHTLQQIQQQLQLQQQQNQSQQHIVLHAITANGTTTTTTLQAQTTSSNPPQYQQITAIAGHNRRKMQLVNRIA